MQRDVEFSSKGLQCRGWLYVPDDLVNGNAAPAIVMAHGFSAVKEMFQVSRYAEKFTDAGFVTLIFDFRFLGASEGDPRGHIVSHEQCEDISNAVRVTPAARAHDRADGAEPAGSWLSRHRTGSRTPTRRLSQTILRPRPPGPGQPDQMRG